MSAILKLIQGRFPRTRGDSPLARGRAKGRKKVPPHTRG